MRLDLSRDAAALRARFSTVDSAHDVADLLEVSYATLVYHLYRVPPMHRYKEFAIRKRSGGLRPIRAPRTHLKILQQKLNTVLQSIYNPRRCAHGFVSGRSTVTNAERHVGSTWVLNVDLADFFPSIHFGRVRGMFQAAPFDRPPAAATVLAQLCCFKNELPQGAPTSPFVSNIMAARLDGELLRLAAEHECVYSRYADDLTFSTYRPDFPDALGCLVSIGDTVKVGVGEALEAAIERNGFVVAESKVRLHYRTERQQVTGVVVNKKLNVPRRYVRELRAILHSWRQTGYAVASARYADKFAKGDQHPLLPPSAFVDFVKGKIGYLSMVRGPADHIVVDYVDQLRDLRRRDGV